MKKREWVTLSVTAFAVAAAVYIVVTGQYSDPAIAHQLHYYPTTRLFIEMAAVFAVSFLCLYLPKTNRARAGGIAILAAAFCWIHQAFLPVLLAGLYICALIKIGSALRRTVDRKTRLPEYTAVTAMADFTLGCGIMILVYCLMSLAGIGAINCTRVAAVLFFALSFLPCFSAKEKTAVNTVKNFWNRESTITFTAALLLAFTVSMVLLETGRMNICMDYDSLHYGLRSEYILNNGGGLYENLGSINVVYTYSKGMEILLFPLSGLPSYGFILSFSMWMAVGILVIGGEIASFFTDRRHGLICTALLAAIPGIMNMGITAKTDCITALFELIMVYFILLYMKRQKAVYFAAAGNAFFMSMVLKPTSVVFSTGIAGIAFLYMICTRSVRFSGRKRYFITWIPMIAMWGLVWLRTFLLTGFPLTSVFTSLWTRLGFEVKYPFLFESIPSNGGSPFSRAGVKHFLTRLFGVLVLPSGEDMSHVWIAWGTPLILVSLLFIAAAFIVRMKKTPKQLKRPLISFILMFLADGALSLAALYLLWQVDGNYFILLYVQCIVLATVVLANMESTVLSGALKLLLVPVVIFNITLTAVTNWCGTLGLTPISLINKGYYDHQAENQEEMRLSGNEEIWSILDASAQTRVVSFGEQPEMLLFPCNTQSYTDIAGSGGNFWVAVTADSFRDFLDYAGTDYVYVEREYLQKDSEEWLLIEDMIRQGYLTDLFFEDGNVLAGVAKDPVLTGDEESLIEEFERLYTAAETF